MKVFYRPEQSALTQSFSPSSSKPALVVEDWAGLVEIESFEPVSRADLVRVHNSQFVDDVLSLKAPNGFNNRDASVAAALPYTSGSMYAAAQHAVMFGEHTCSPTSGFHHAGYDFAEGFCTFNGLMVTAAKLHHLGLADKVAIVDCDAHFGNGTDDIIRWLGAGWVQHLTMGRYDVKGQDYLDLLHNQLQRINADVVLYQAGADAHIHDPLGGILTTDEMLARDEMVFWHFRHQPLAWNLAGGYQRLDVLLQLHRQTLNACKGRHERTDPTCDEPEHRSLDRAVALA